MTFDHLRTSVPPHTTSVVDEPWDALAIMRSMPNDALTLRHMHAWVVPGGNPDDPRSYLLPHHHARSDAPANIHAVRDALARLALANIPDADRLDCETHLRRHLEEASHTRSGSGPIGADGNHYRTYSPDMQVRASGDGRTIFGIAVPYNTPVRINDALVETFAGGAFNHQLRDPHRVRVSREHWMLGGDLIGAASLLRDDAAGLYAELRVSRTPRGDETLELVRDGALNQLSIMFRERQNRTLKGGAIERVKADLKEIAIVMEGAYGELAAAAGVRSRQIPVAAQQLDLAAAAEEFLHGGGLPDLRDYELEIRRIRLGMPL